MPFTRALHSPGVRKMSQLGSRGSACQIHGQDRSPERTARSPAFLRAQAGDPSSVVVNAEREGSHTEARISAAGQDPACLIFGQASESEAECTAKEC